MMLAYFIVCPWEAVAIGRIAGYIFPSLDSVEIYRIAGRPVYLPHLVVGVALTVLLTILNYRGVRLSATFQNWTTFGTLALFVVFVAVGAARGSPRNFSPLFTHAPLVSFLLVLQIVPYFMTGFDAVGKAAEESTPEFRGQSFFTAVWIAILIGILFYTIIIAAVAFVAPWHELTGNAFMTAVAFQHAVGARWVVDIILAAALLSLVKCFNGNFVVASRLLFALGRRGLIDERAGFVHPTHRTPSAAVLCVGIATALCMLLGDAILVPVTEVGSVACGLGWTATCAAYLAMRRSGKLQGDLRAGLPAMDWLIAVFGLLVAIAMSLMKIVPAIPGHFTGYEWLALGVWIALGVIFRKKETEKTKAVLVRSEKR
jgi:basic amino acid/polyamine antiporter, APA family